MDYAILGPLAARVDGRELPLGGPRQRALLALLLVRANELVRTVRIVEELWPAGAAPATAVKTVQVYVSQLRKALGEEAIETHGAGYLLPLTADELDAARFERLVGRSRAALAHDPAGAAGSARAALALWRGSPLPDAADLGFAQGEIQRLEELRLVAVEQLLEAELALGHHAQAVPELERLVAEHPLRDRPRELLMLALYRAGRQADALAVYHDGRRALVDDLGLEPGAELQRLERAILVHDPELAPTPEPLTRAPAAAQPEPRPVAADCPACGARSVAGARFCGVCGTELPYEQPIELRKVVTVLFCDVVASTELGESLDPEADRRLMSRYFGEAGQVIRRHGGTVEKFIGDEVMAVFGVPAVRQDDALRAVRAAAELCERVPQLRVPEWEGRLQVRIGVNTGEVVAGDPSAGHGFVTGDAVNVAKRLEQAAQPGEIVIGGGTYALVAHAVVPSSVEALTLKGKARPVEAVRIERVDADAAPFPVRADVPLLGRDRELALLLDAFAAARTDGGRRATVVGEPGIGKSRLARELARRVETEAAVVVGRCPPYGEGLAFRPLREVFAQAGRGDETVRLGGHEVFAAARRLLEELAAERPLLVVFEDVHWADETFLDLIEYLGARLQAAPVLLLCLARPELAERRPGWLRDAVLLEPLDASASEQLLAALGTPPRLRSGIAGTAEGNPLFVEQLAAIADVDAPLPASIRGVLAERLDRLAREERAVLERAAVVGREFSLEDVVHLCPERLREQAPGRLLALVREGLIAPVATVYAGEGFRFRHALIRDATYDGMPKVVRSDLHALLAGRLEADGRDDEVVGHHLEQAYRNRSDLGRDDAETRALGGDAARVLETAGCVAIRNSDLSGALSLLERAAALVEPSAPSGPALLTRLGYVRNKVGDFAGAVEALDRAVGQAAAAGDRSSELRARIERQFARSFASPRQAAADNVRLAQEVLPELERLGDELGQAKAWWLRSEGDVFACRWREREVALEHALAHARRADDALDEPTMLIGLLSQALYYGPTPAADALARCEQLLAAAGRDRALRTAVSTSIAGLLAMQGRFDEARRLHADATAVAEELGLRLRAAGRAAIGAQVELLAGDGAAAELLLRQACDAAAELGAVALETTLLALLADVLVTVGRWGEADELARSVAEAASADDLVPQVLWRSSLVRASAVHGEHPDAAVLAAEALELTEGVEFPSLRVAALAAAAELAAAQGRPRAAARLLGDAHGLMAAKGNAVAAARLGERVAQVGAAAGSE